MSKRLPWGHESRHCLRCGNVGPRVRSGAGYIHAYCRTPEEKRTERERIVKQNSTPKSGDWFLLPFAGPLRTRVIQAVRPATMGGGQWTVRSGRTGRIQAGYTLLSSCHPLTTKRAIELLSDER